MSKKQFKKVNNFTQLIRLMNVLLVFCPIIMAVSYSKLTSVPEGFVGDLISSLFANVFIAALLVFAIAAIPGMVYWSLKFADFLLLVNSRIKPNSCRN